MVVIRTTFQSPLQNGGYNVLPNKKKKMEASPNKT